MRLRTDLRRILAGMALLAACGLAAPAPAAEGDPVGAVTRVENRAVARSGTGERALAPPDAVLFGDRLATGPAARLEATLDDGTRLTLGENAELGIDAFVYEPGGAAGRLALRVLDGTFLFVGGRVEDAPGAEVTIATGFATLEIRGTTVWGGPIDGAFGVLVLEGTVTVTAGGQTVTLTPGLGTTLTGPDAAPAAPVTWPQDKVDRAVATVTFTP